MQVTQGNARRALDGGEHDARLHVAHVRYAQQLFQNDGAQRFEILAEHLQDEIVRAGDGITMRDFVEQVDLTLEPRHALIGVLAQLHVHDGLHLEPDTGRTQQGRVALDDARRLERLDAPCAGRGRQADGLGEFDDGQPTVALQLGEDAGIETVEIHGSRAPVGRRIGDYHQQACLKEGILAIYAAALGLVSSDMAARIEDRSSPVPPQAVDWLAVVHQVAVSRALDDLEETVLVPERKVLYQFSARGHDVTQVLLGQVLTGARDALGGYYRSRPLLLTLGLSIEEALASTMMRVGSMSEGRDIGVVFNLPRRDGPCALPVCGGVGTQFTPAVGWAQALRYREEVLGDASCKGSIAVAHGGDASTATNGFWSALNIATTQRLPLLFFIEDNGYGISV